MQILLALLFLLLLDEVNRKGLLKKGVTILFAAVGSGWTYGASILKWD